MTSEETPDPEARPSDESTPTTDRRSFLSAVGAGAVSIALGDDPRSLSAGTRTTGSLPWTESFDVDDGATADSGDTAWQLDDASTHPGVAVEAGALTARTTDGPARWRSEPIDVSGVDAADLAVTVRGSGKLRAPPDRDLPPIAGSNEPTDPDHDGIYEDVDGDGAVDTDDAKTLLENLDDPDVTRVADAYDQNCNDRLDYADVIALGHEARGNGNHGGDCARVGDHLTVAYVLDGQRTVVERTTDVASDGETIEATGLSGTELVVEITARTDDPETAYHVEEVSVAEPDDTTPGETASSVSQYGITWEFAEERPVGQYANGDWWVQGPVTITKITPESTVEDGRVKHGTTVNARGKAHGFDSYDSTAVVKVNKPDKPWDSPSHSYDESLNRDPSRTGEPLELDTGTVFSSISIPDEEIRDTGRPTLRDLALLTVVDEEPPEGAFRPNPYSDDDKTSNWTEDDLDYSILKNRPVVEPMPDTDALVDQALRFWNEQETTWKQRPFHAKNNQAAYGRGIGKRSGQMLLLLHLDIDEDVKRDLFVGLVQYGLDNYGRFKAGSPEFKSDVRWKANGGHNVGRKMPVVLAGLALDDSGILSVADRDEDPDRFQEDGQTFFVTEDDVGKNVVDDHETYREEDVGMPEWGVNHWSDGTADDRRWGASYRWIGSAFVPHALAAHLTDGAVDAWNHPAFFEYVDRYEERGSPDPNQPNAIDEFAQACWDEYRDTG